MHTTIKKIFWKDNFVHLIFIVTFIWLTDKKDYRFQADENGLLIATDVAARGLDIPNIEHVIHYQVPRTAEVNVLLQMLTKHIKILIM